MLCNLSSALNQFYFLFEPIQIHVCNYSINFGNNGSGF